MQSNKTRIALTGFSITWGIFIFIVLIGSVAGLRNGFSTSFNLLAANVVELVQGKTSLSFQGQPKGRVVPIYEEDGYRLQALWGDTIPAIVPIMKETLMLLRKAHTSKVSTCGTTPGYDVTTNTRIVEGRDLNSIDLQQLRKVCIIPKTIKKALFPDIGIPVIGQHVQLSDIDFEVVGVSESKVSTEINNTIICPLTAMQIISRPDRHLDELHLKTEGLTTEELNKTFNARMLRVLADMKSFAPTDAGAVTIKNYYEDAVWFSQVLSGISVFVVIIGLATLISGVVGISNIMLITVKERTRELGVRRVMGASKSQIVFLVLSESVFITVIFGYVGMFLGITLTLFASWGLEEIGQVGIFEHPTVSFSAVMGCNVIMLLAGMLAMRLPNEL